MNVTVSVILRYSESILDSRRDHLATVVMFMYFKYRLENAVPYISFTFSSLCIVNSRTLLTYFSEFESELIGPPMKELYYNVE